MKHLLLGLMLLFCVSAKGIKVTHGPWICDMDSTGVTIVWVTDVPGISYVEMATDSTDHFYSKTRKRYYAAEAGRRILTDSVHCVRIRGLKPDSKYRYRVVTQALKDWCNDDWVTLGGLAWSDVWKKKPYEFKTYPANHEKSPFWY